MKKEEKMKVNKRAIVFPLLVMFLLFSLAPYTALAGHGKTKGCHKGLDQKIFYKAGMILKNQDELGLSDKQVAEIKDLKIAVKKGLIKRGAEIDLVAVDIKAKMYADKIDVEGAGKLIDEKYKLKAAKAKYLLKAYADLKGILTEEQAKGLKALCHKSYKKK